MIRTLVLTSLGLLASSPAIPAQTSARPSATLDLRAAAAELPQLRSLLVSWRSPIPS